MKNKPTKLDACATWIILAGSIYFLGFWEGILWFLPVLFIYFVIVELMSSPKKKKLTKKSNSNNISIGK
jgi:hypothetical protein